jgi:hypothetical protein
MLTYDKKCRSPSAAQQSAARRCPAEREAAEGASGGAGQEGQASEGQVSQLLEALAKWKEVLCVCGRLRRC